MNILLDTCAFLWLITGADQLSRQAEQLVLDEGNEVYLSAISCWEIALKTSAGKLRLPAPPADYLPRQRESHNILSLPLDEKAALFLPRLPSHHRDPFDRMLVTQAIVRRCPIITLDSKLSRYPIHTIGTDAP